MIQKNFWTLMTASLLLQGCQWLPKFPAAPIPPEPQIITVTEKVPLRIYQPPLPAEIDLLDVNFFVITEENLDEQVKTIEKMLDGQFVVFALTPDGYEKMAENFQEVRRYVRQQKELIIYYREATTESEGTTAEEWLNNNEN
jgi:hypothetical protein